MFRKTLDFLDKVLTFFEEWTLFVSVMAALVSLFVNVVMRYGFNQSLAWSEELVREVIIYTTFIGCSAAVKNRSMIRIDASVQLFPKLKTALTLFQQFCRHGLCRHDDLLRVADGGASGSHPPEDDHPADSARLSLRRAAVDGGDDDDSCGPGYGPGHRGISSGEKTTVVHLPAES